MLSPRNCSILVYETLVNAHEKRRIHRKELSSASTTIYYNLVGPNHVGRGEMSGQDEPVVRHEKQHKLILLGYTLVETDFHPSFLIL